MCYDVLPTLLPCVRHLAQAPVTPLPLLTLFPAPLLAKLWQREQGTVRIIADFVGPTITDATGDYLHSARRFAGY